MKRLVCMALVAGSMFVFADEAAQPAEAAKEAASAVNAAEPQKPRARAPQASAEQRQKIREMHEKRMAERRAAMEAKMLEVVKKYGLDDEKAKALVKELQETVVPSRATWRGRRPGRPSRPRPGVQPQTQAPVAAEAK